MNLKFGTDGIRGPVESIITPEACLKIGHATGFVMKELGWDTVVIGKDTRISGYMLESALQAGFIAAGVNVRLLGPLPTPGVAYLTKTLRIFLTSFQKNLLLYYLNQDHPYFV